MKKVLSFALVLAMILGSVSMVFAAATSYPDIKGIDEEEAINVLTGLGVLEGYPDGTFKPEGHVTRAEMVKMICAALALPVTEGTYTTKFTDVKPDAWYSAYVYYAITLGIVEGKSETIFDPNGDVTYDQAITMVMRALGYTEAGLNGVYPACFVSKAVGLGALKGLQSGSEAATRAHMAQLIYNVLTKQIGKVGQDDKWGANGEEDNMLKRLGAVVAKDPQDPDKNDEAVVGVDIDPDDENTLVNLHDLIGHKITYYVSKDDNKKIVAVYEVKTVEIVGKYNGTDKIKDTKLTDDADPLNPQATFLNGVQEDFTPEAKTNYTWIVEMKGAKVDNVVSVCDWVVNADKKVTADDLKDLTDEDEPALLGYNFKLDDDDKLDLNSFALVGVDKLEDIEKNNIVYVYAAEKDGEDVIVKVEVGTQTKTGDVDEVIGSNGRPVVDGTTYKLAVENTKGLTKAVNKAGMLEWAQAGNESATLYLDVNGDVHTITDATVDSAYALVLKYQAAQEDQYHTIDGSKAKAEIFNAKGEDKVLELSDDLVVKMQYVGEDGKVKTDTIKDPEDALECFEYYFRTAMLVKVAEDGKEITEITFPVTEGDTDVRINKKGIIYGLENEDKFGDNIPVFSFKGTSEGDYEKASKWSVIKAEALYGTEPDWFEAVIEKGVVKVAVVEGGSSEKDNYVFFTGWSEVANKTYKLTVMEDGAAATYKSKKNWDLDCDVKNGLYLWKLTLDSDNKITSVEPFQYDNEDSLFMVPITFPTDKALEVKTTNEYVQIDEDYFTLADQVYVYLFDKDKKLTVKNLNFLDGLRTKKYGGIVLFDTVEKNEEFNIIVVVENADNMPTVLMVQ